MAVIPTVSLGLPVALISTGVLIKSVVPLLLSFGQLVTVIPTGISGGDAAVIPAHFTLRLRALQTEHFFEKTTHAIMRLVCAPIKKP